MLNTNTQTEYYTHNTRMKYNVPKWIMFNVLDTTYFSMQLHSLNEHIWRWRRR